MDSFKRSTKEIIRLQNENANLKYHIEMLKREIKNLQADKDTPENPG